MSPHSAPLGPENEPFDRQRVLVAADGSLEFLKQMVRIVAERDGPRLLHHLRSAAESADAAALASAAHGLGGIAGELAADPTHALATRLEALAANADWEEALPLATELESEFGALVEALTSFVDDGGERHSELDGAGGA